MANFFVTLDAQQIAEQIASLLNTYNKLRKRHTAYTILNGRGAYFVDIVGHKVVGCQALLRENHEVTRLFHLCVDPDYRRRGIARKLKETALSHVETPYALVTIREDNVASISLNVSMGFVQIKKEWAGDHNVLTLMKVMTDVRPTTDSMVGAEPGRLHTGRPNVSADGLFYTG